MVRVPGGNNAWRGRMTFRNVKRIGWRGRAARGQADEERMGFKRALSCSEGGAVETTRVLCGRGDCGW